MPMSRDSSPRGAYGGAPSERPPNDDREEQRRWFKQLEFENHGDNVLERSTTSSERQLDARRRHEEDEDVDPESWTQRRPSMRSSSLDHRRPASSPVQSYERRSSKPIDEPIRRQRVNFEESSRARTNEVEEEEQPSDFEAYNSHPPTRSRYRRRSPSPRCYRKHRTFQDYLDGDMNNSHPALPPTGRRESNVSGIKMKPENYDGKEDFDSYLERFETCAVLNGWNLRERCLVLSTKMVGTARTFFQTLPYDVKGSYRYLVQEFKGRFGSGSKHTQYWITKFNERLRKSDEPIATLADEILLLAQKAYPKGMTQENLNQVALQQLYKSLDSDTKWKCIEARVDTIGDAVEIVETYEAFAKGGNKKSVRQVTADDSNSSKLMKEIVERIKTLESQSQRRPPGRYVPRNDRVLCYACNEYGHVAYSCPNKYYGNNRDNQDNSNIQGNNRNTFRNQGNNRNNSASGFKSGNSGN